MFLFHLLFKNVPDDVFLRNLATIAAFLFYFEAKLFVSPKKAENCKCVFVKIKTE